MVNIKNLINPLILDDCWVGFSGDSEFISEDGNVKYGTWEFVKILDEPTPGIVFDCELEYDDVVGICYWEVMNNRGDVCLVKTTY